MAKGVEDTVFYNYNRFIALNEVGGDPVAVRHQPSSFPREGARDAAAVAAHDARHRNPRQQARRGHACAPRAAVRRAVGVDRRQCVDGRRWPQPHRTNDWPDREHGVLLLPDARRRVARIAPNACTAYMEKAWREAKTYTSWTAPDTAYEAAFARSSRRAASPIVTDAGHQAVRRAADRTGRVNSLAQTLIKLTAPGVPDLYQGTELWSLHLVDPDNRRPVDYEERRRALAEVKQLSAREIWDRADEGLPKMWVTHAALQLRQRQRDAFDATAAIALLTPSGPLADHIVAFCRGESVMTIVPRLVIRADGRWHGTGICVPQGSWTNVLTGQAVRAAAPSTSRNSGETFRWHCSSASAVEENDERH